MLSADKTKLYVIMGTWGEEVLLRRFQSIQ
jgi:hypothetical protein